MDATEILTQVLAYTDNINPTDTEYADRRLRLQHLLQELADDVCTEAEWTWLRKTAQLTVDAGDGYADLPTDFGQLGDYGAVHLVASHTGTPLTHETEHVVREARAQNHRTSSPGYFSIFGNEPDPLDATVYLRRIQFPLNDDAYDILVDYLRKTPTIDEAGNVNAIKLIPEEWHQRTLIPGLRAKTLESKGDERWQNHYAMYKEGLAKMRAKFRRRQGTIYQLPSFFGYR